MQALPRLGVFEPEGRQEMEGLRGKDQEIYQRLSADRRDDLCACQNRRECTERLMISS